MSASASAGEQAAEALVVGQLPGRGQLQLEQRHMGGIEVDRLDLHRVGHEVAHGVAAARRDGDDPARRPELQGRQVDLGVLPDLGVDQPLEQCARTRARGCRAWRSARPAAPRRARGRWPMSVSLEVAASGAVIERDAAGADGHEARRPVDPAAGVEIFDRAAARPGQVEHRAASARWVWPQTITSTALLAGIAACAGLDLGLRPLRPTCSRSSRFGHSPLGQPALA